MAEEEKINEDVHSIRTFKTDALSFATDKKTSFIQVAAEKLAKQRQVEVRAERSTRALKTVVIWLAVLFIVAMIAGALYFYITSRPTNVAEAPVRETIIAADLESAPLLQRKTRAELLYLYQKNVAEPLAEGEVRIAGFLVEEGESKRFLNAPEIIAISELSLPLRLSQNIISLELGAVRAGNIEPLFVLKIRSYPEAFAAMLEWEKSLAGDIGIFFTKTRNFEFVGEVFQDVVIKNQDARVLYKDGEGALAYAFYNRNVLIITPSDRALDTILSRLQAL